jgi:hypothetical protein
MLGENPWHILGENTRYILGESTRHILGENTRYIIARKMTRGRKRSEEHLPQLLDDIQAIVDEQSQTDPTFKTTRLYTRITAQEVRQQLIRQKGYTDEEW